MSAQATYRKWIRGNLRACVVEARYCSRNYRQTYQPHYRRMKRDNLELARAWQTLLAQS